MRQTTATWLAACAFGGLGACSVDHSGYPVVGGGGGPITGGGSNANLDSGVVTGDGPTISGRVCLMSDPRVPTSCAATGANGLMVSIGASAAVLTEDDGSFTIATPSGSTLEWFVTGQSIQSSEMVLGVPPYVIPAITSATYNLMIETNVSTFTVAGHGGLIAYLTSGGVPLVGATASATLNDNNVFYDGPSAESWLQLHTGADGVVWIPELEAPQDTALTITPSGGTAEPIGNVPIGDGALTFISLAL